MRLCIKCVLPETLPSITFDENGICNYCLSYNKDKNHDTQKQRAKNKFLEILEKYRGKNTYDCLLAYSGGKDSTYTLSLLKEQFQLKILAVTFDNWFLSEAAFKNAQTVLSHLDVDHLILRPRYSILKKIFQTVCEKNIYSPKTIERASTICTSCLGLIRYSFLRLAIEKEIPFIVFGLSPGQAAVNTAVFKNNPMMVKSMQKAIYEPMHKILGDEIKPYFLEEKHFNNTDRFPYNINILAFWKYDEEMMLNKIKEYGWKAPQDTDTNSTNCLLNSFANIVHQEQFGFHPYAFEISTLIREGCMTREQGIEKLSIPPDENVIKYVKQKLEIK